MIYIFWSAEDSKEAKRIVSALLEKRLIACASILPQVESIYRWEGKVENSIEAKVILKTKEEFFEPILHFIEKEGSYDVPEVSLVKVEKGNPSYLDWLEKEL